MLRARLPYHTDRYAQPTPPPSIITPDALRLKIEPTADCGRYDSIRKIA
jgi:hypothetical protein